MFRRSKSVHRVWWIRGFEATLICVAMTLLVALAAHAFGTLLDGGAWWLLAPAAILGVLAADFGTGAIHWLCDRFFREDTPVIGPVLIRPFREHHVHPEAMTHNGLLELHGNSCIPVIAVLALALLGAGERTGRLELALDLWLVVFLGASLATNQFHMWAHARQAPAFVRWLQRKGVILSPERHARHHRAGFDRSYCMTSGLLNPLLDRIDFFGNLERGIRSLQRAAR
jgi:ubiquitin-conjugating enzyme E2 variant